MPFYLDKWSTLAKKETDRFHLYAGIFLLLGLLAAYLSHLAYIPLNNQNDEARRALVSLEMILSGDYLTPTLNGEIYLNKPPLYNWIIIAYVKLFGDFSMFSFRLPVIVATVLMGGTIHHFTRKFTSPQVAFFTAFAFMTNGRILIYDSFIGLIDTSFSLVVYLQFMWVYWLGEKKKYGWLFLLTYLLAAIGFLMKGMPALVFQGFTLLTYFIWKKKFRLLFHPMHFAGVGLFLLITGSYYYAYFTRNDLAPVTLFSNLFTESSKRTPAHFSWQRTILHFFSFPVELLYHYAPWTLFVVALFNKQAIRLLKGNDFMVYSFLVLIVNIFVYWLSPEVYARYLFMFIPLLYSLLFYAFFSLAEKHWSRKWVDGITLFLSLALGIGFFVLPFLDVVRDNTDLWLRCFGLAIGFLILAFVGWKAAPFRLYTLIAAVILFRLGFNWFILAPRAEKFVEVEKLSHEIVALTKGQPLYILRDAQVGNFDGMSFHMAKARGEILRFSKQMEPGIFYIADKNQLANRTHTTYLSFSNYLSDSLYVVQFK
ncbi:MAG: glycosyltransferase family 39 protein [Chitinophagaceae bacterium]|nr:glycosyltransferase family 39 protein [Chitinophagaceae bacterium]